MGEPKLSDQVARRLIEAGQRIADLDVSRDEAAMLQKRLLALRLRADYDLTHASREVEQLHLDLDAGMHPIYGQG